MIKKGQFERAKENHPEISDMEIHFYNMKYCGAHEEEMAKGETRPVFYMFDDDNFALISFMLSEDDSPYSADGDAMTFDGKTLTFETVKATRLGYKLPYFYFRGSVSLHPTLDGMNILNTNFHSRCGGCDFCFYGYRNKHLSNISAEDGFRLVEEETGSGDLSYLGEIAVVTGMFPTEQDLRAHLMDTLKVSHDRGFRGRLHYIGSQLVTPIEVSKVMKAAGGPEKFKYVYTVERFFDRDKIMHGKKGRKTHGTIVEDMKIIRAEGVNQLQYTYLVGIEDLDRFRTGADAFVGIATPHISIFRKTGLDENEMSMSDDYVRMGPDYTCRIRKHYDQLYGPVIGNNFANLWTFPRSRINIPHYLAQVRDGGGT